MNLFTWLLPLIIIAHMAWEAIVDILNLRHLSPVIPQEFEEYYEKEKYAQSQQYLKDNTRFGLVQSLFSTAAILILIYSGLLNVYDQWVRSLVSESLPAGLLFFGGLGLATLVLNQPFSLYRTFVIEERYGFNKTTISTYVGDLFKQALLGAFVGGIILTLTLVFFDKLGNNAWWIAWTSITLLQVILTFLTPAIIMPLFNKFTPLPEGELKNAIEGYAKKQKFSLKGIYTMDGSKRSTKANAFFTGFGKYRRIVLFDTLVSKFSTDELLSVLAHEMGHYKLRHIVKMLLLSTVSMGLMLFLLSYLIMNPELAAAAGMQEHSLYGNLFLFTLIYTPIQTLLSIASYALSRKHEFEADAYATSTVGKVDAFSEVLKKLSVDHLSNLTPHPLKVFTEYSHPPVLARLKAIASKVNSH